jgi:hypothetical protein
MKHSNRHSSNIPEPGVVEGLLFIPDISGFTQLVHSTNAATGKIITAELLTAIISQNQLKLAISEVEGDAVLFYRYGTAPSLQQLMLQFKKMETAFHKKRKQLENRFSLTLDVSLKVIAHYGQMIEYRVGPFTKLYGEVVVEAHRLLKNAVQSDSYLLLSDSLYSKIAIADDEILHKDFSSARQCETYRSLSQLCFTCFDFTAEQKAA